MEIIHHESNLNTKLPLRVSIWEIDLSAECLSDEQITAAFVFDILKKKHFMFDDGDNKIEKVEEANADKDYNYSNFSLSQIQFSDFKQIGKEYLNDILEEKISQWANVYGNMKESELSWFIGLTNNQIENYAAKYSDTFLFDLDPNALEHPKRHPYFSLYEFFISLLLTGDKGFPNRMCYVLLAYG